MENPEAAIAIAKAVVPIVDRLINAHIESKRIDLEIEAVRARAEVEHHRLEVQEKALELQHKENMKYIDEQANQFLKKIDVHRKSIEANMKVQSFLCGELKRINDVILDINTPEETRDKFIALYDRVSQRIENITMGHLQTSIKLIQTNDLLCLPDRKSSSEKQISTIEEN